MRWLVADNNFTHTELDNDSGISQGEGREGHEHGTIGTNFELHSYALTGA